MSSIVPAPDAGSGPLLARAAGPNAAPQGGWLAEVAQRAHAVPRAAGAPAVDIPIPRDAPELSAGSPGRAASNCDSESEASQPPDNDDWEDCNGAPGQRSSPQAGSVAGTGGSAGAFSETLGIGRQVETAVRPPVNAVESADSMMGRFLLFRDAVMEDAFQSERIAGTMSSVPCFCWPLVFVDLGFNFSRMQKIEDWSTALQSGPVALSIGAWLVIIALLLFWAMHRRIARAVGLASPRRLESAWAASLCILNCLVLLRDPGYAALVMGVDPREAWDEAQIEEFAETSVLLVVLAGVLMAHVALPCRFAWSVGSSISVACVLPTLKALMWVRQGDMHDLPGVHFSFSLQEEVGTCMAVATVCSAISLGHWTAERISRRHFVQLRQQQVLLDTVQSQYDQASALSRELDRRNELLEQQQDKLQRQAEQLKAQTGLLQSERARRRKADRAAKKKAAAKPPTTDLKIVKEDEVMSQGSSGSEARVNPTLGGPGLFGARVCSMQDSSKCGTIVRDGAADGQATVVWDATPSGRVREAMAAVKVLGPSDIGDQTGASVAPPAWDGVWEGPEHHAQFSALEFTGALVKLADGTTVEAQRSQVGVWYLSGAVVTPGPDTLFMDLHSGERLIFVRPD